MDAAGGGAGRDPDLVGWWQFEEGSGDIASDSSGYGNDGKILHGGWGRGKRGGGLTMTGTQSSEAGDDGIVIVPISDSLRAAADEITVMSWTYRTAEHNVAVVAHDYPTLFFGFHGPRFKWQIQGEPANGFAAGIMRRLGMSSVVGDRVRDGRGASCYRDLDQTAVLNEWIHLAATYDGSRAKLYVDGVEICDRRFWGSIGIGDSPFTISGYLNESREIADEITGTIDDVRIYKRALDGAEIRSIYLRESE